MFGTDCNIDLLKIKTTIVDIDGSEKCSYFWFKYM